MSTSWNDIVLGLYHLKKFWIEKQTQPSWIEQPFLQNTNRSEVLFSTFDHSCLAAAWILVTQVSVEEWACDAVWEKATFRTQVWLLERNAEAPVLMHQELAQMHHPGKAVSFAKLVNTIDQVVIEREYIYVRDKRLLSNNQLSVHTAWRKFLRPNIA